MTSSKGTLSLRPLIENLPHLQSQTHLSYDLTHFHHIMRFALILTILTFFLVPIAAAPQGPRDPSKDPDVPKDPKEPPKVPPQQPPKVPEEPPKQPPQEPPKEPPKQPPTVPPKEPPKQPPSVPPKQPPQEPPEQPPTVPPKEPPKQPPNQPPTYPPKQPQPPKEPPKQPQPPKQPPKQPQPPKEPPKQPPKQPQPPKEPPKEPQPPKEPPKQPQPPKEPPKQPQPPKQPPQKPPTIPVRYSEYYDQKSLSLNSVACSNGPNGLLTKGYKTLGSLQNFPYIGGATAVSGWNSPKCGSCWEISYNGQSVNILAVDTAGEGFILSKAALNKLTGLHAVDFGVVQATAKELPPSQCGT